MFCLLTFSPAPTLPRITTNIVIKGSGRANNTTDYKNATQTALNGAIYIDMPQTPLLKFSSTNEYPA
jgi:hypothetical protein